MIEAEAANTTSEPGGRRGHGWLAVILASVAALPACAAATVQVWFTPYASAGFGFGMALVAILLVVAGSPFALAGLILGIKGCRRAHAAGARAVVPITAIILALLAPAATGVLITAPDRSICRYGNATMCPADYDALAIGTPQAQVRAELGRPMDDTEQGMAAAQLYYLPPPPSGTSCDYYWDSEGFMDPPVYRLCYRDGRLAQKNTT